MCLTPSGSPNPHWLVQRSFLKAGRWLKWPFEAPGKPEFSSSSSPTLRVLILQDDGLRIIFFPPPQNVSESQETDHPCVFFFSLESRLPPGCDRHLHSFFCGGWGLPSCREWSSHHSAPLLLLVSSYLQAPGPCNRGTGYQSPPAQGGAGRGLNSRKGESDPETQGLLAPGLLPHLSTHRTTVP